MTESKIGPSWIVFETFEDSRGVLEVIESSKLPFRPARFFFTSVNEDGAERGSHAHKECWQILFCLSGEIEVQRVWSSGSEVYHLRANGKALVIPPGNWCREVFITKQSLMGVIASHSYDPTDYMYRFEEIQD